MTIVRHFDKGENSKLKQHQQPRETSTNTAFFFDTAVRMGRDATRPRPAAELAVAERDWGPACAGAPVCRRQCVQGRKGLLALTLSDGLQQATGLQRSTEGA